MNRNTEYCGGECHGDCDVIPTPCRDADALLRHITTITEENKKLKEALRLIQHHSIIEDDEIYVCLKLKLRKIRMMANITLTPQESDNE